MAYIGQKPGSNFRGVTIKDSFTGDGSTVAFDLSKSFNQAGQNDLEIFVDNVRQEPTTAYTVGQDGSGNFKRVTFTAAPAASASIYVLNQGESSGVLSVSDGAITSGKLNADAITGHTELAEAPADTDTFLVHDASASTLKKIQNSNLVGSALITGKDEITIGNVASNDVLLIFDTSAGVLKKITKSAFDALQPGFSSVTPSNLISGDGTGNHTIVVAGTDFDNSASFKLVTDGGTDIAMDSVSRDSSVQLTGTVAKNKANLTNANEPFDVVITNGNGLTVTSANAVNIDAQPAWVTSAGSIGTISHGSRTGYSVTVTATDPESGSITYALVSGALPGGLSLNTSSGVISGDASAVGTNTTYNFTIEARDSASNATERAFSLIVNAPVVQSFTSSGTFSVPSGVTAVDVLVVAGGGGGGGAGNVASGQGGGSGGGGAGGLIFRPGFTVTPGGTVTVTVGDGGNGGSSIGATNGQNGQTGQDSAFGTLSAKGGGAGGGVNGPGNNGAGGDGGSGGGAGDQGAPGGANGAGAGTQPTQSGDSGNYGFGNDGGSTPSGANSGGAGGGGAGAAGQNGTAASPGHAGSGGVGKAYTIADGTTSVYYAGGGNGGGADTSANWPAAVQGGGGRASILSADSNGPGSDVAAQPGTANRGGGGGAMRDGPQSPSTAGFGGKGIVIVSY